MNSNLCSQKKQLNDQIRPSFSWQDVETVFLDLDGTLLDRYFDDYFWEQYVPRSYAAKEAISYEQARNHLLETYRSVQNTLAWTDLDYWSHRLGLNIVELKLEIGHLVALRPGTETFLSFLQSLGKEIVLVTNAHPKTLEVKMGRQPLLHWFTNCVSATDIGYAKEQSQFWPHLHEYLPYDRETTLFIDDNERVLHSAAGYGIHQLIHVARPSSRQPLAYSATFPSIGHFTELIELPENATLGL